MFAIASVIKDWRLLAPSLLLTESDQEEIAQNFEDNFYLQKKEALVRWRYNVSGGPERSTYRALIRIFCLEKQIAVAEKIAGYCGSKEPPVHNQMLDRLNWYLLECYRCLPHPFFLQLPSRLSPPFPKSSELSECKFFCTKLT
jgi:hypothetical protein